jgi:hypothetical protein
MRRAPIGLIVGCLLAGGLKAAPPTCQTKVQDGTTFEVCTRTDLACESLAKAQLKDPSDKWNGCFWPATIIKGHVITNGVMIISIYVSIIASYRDSERADVTVTIEQPDHTYRKFERKEVPIIIRDSVPTASVDILSNTEPVGVPTVEATEKGGKIEAAHSYR